MRCLPVLSLLAFLSFVNAAAPPQPKPPRLDVNGDPLPAGAVARLGTTRFLLPDREWRFRSRPDTVALSPDGKTIVVLCGNDKGVRVDFLDTSTGKRVRRIGLGCF
jgi:hypothetical protein